MILSYIEFLLPPLFSAVPGIKMGLANIIIIFILYKFGIASAFAVSGVRLVLVTLLFGNVMTLLYSTAGALLSLVLMSIAKRINFFSQVGVSIIGGVAHNAGQILVAMLVMETAEIGYYMIVLTVSGTIAGILIGLAGSAVLHGMRKVKI
jgi:heptaprenyl diphosphate synthase